MWPFKKKPESMLMSREDYSAGSNKLKEFRGVGERFNYMGVEMMVESFSEYNRYGLVPVLTAVYINADGDLRREGFTVNCLPVLMVENPVKKVK